jgi:hypothetical protein
MTLQRLSLSIFLPLFLAVTYGASRAATQCTGTHTIADVQPAVVSNTSSTTLVITGTGFLPGATVVLENYGGLTTAVTNANLLDAILPQGAPPGAYSVRVVNGDGSCALHAAPITVSGPAAPTAPSATPAPTQTPVPTQFMRPILNVDSYGASSPVLIPGQDLDFDMTLVNWGPVAASNIVINFTPGDFTPRVTGGVRTVSPLAPGERARFYQPLTAGRSLWGKSTGTLEVQVTYTDSSGKTYNEKFNLTFPIVGYNTATPTPTASATPSLRPRVLVTGHTAGTASIQPGSGFTLSLDIQNVGNTTAKNTVMTLGGSSGTPGAGGDFSTFAPQNSSNVQFLGDLAPGAALTARQALTVSGTARAGSYTLRFSFTASDEQGNTYTDEQVITVLVQNPPLLEVGFSEEPEPFVEGAASALPLQVINRGQTSVTLGNMKVTAPGARLSNNISLVGAVDAGNFFTLDATIIPEAEGPLELTITFDYTDAFNQLQTITKTLTIQVEDSGLDPAGEGSVGSPGESVDTREAGSWGERLWQAILRFFGLGG